MLIKNCVVKRSQDGTWLHHTASGYKVKMNQEALDVLLAMAARRSAAEMTEKEKFIYDKLAAKGIAGEDNGREEDRRVIVREKSRLASVDLEFSGRCNLRCAHCFAALSRMNMGRETLEKVFAGIDALEPATLTVNGGEPLLNPLLPDALARARARHMRVNIMTNATLVTEDTADLLREHGVAVAAVSLDFFEDSHDAIRGRGTFAKTVNGIKLLVSRKVPVSITAMVQESTAGLVEDFKNFCLGELGASSIRFSSVSPIGSAKDSPGLELPPSKARDLFSRGLIPKPGESADALAKLTGTGTFSCLAGVGQCFIAADGKVYACHYLQNLGESMGDLAGQPLEAVYRQYQKSGAMPVALDWNKLKKCAACAHFGKCLGGCRARARLVSGSWYAPDAHTCAMYGAELELP